MRRRVLLAALVPPLVAGLLTGCGVSTTGPEAAGAPASGLASPGSELHHARLYFVGPHGSQVVSRRTPAALGPQAALDLLLDGPTRAERARGLHSVLPPMNGGLTARPAGRGKVSVDLPYEIADMELAAVGQIACTAADAELPGDVPPDEVDVDLYELGEREPFTVHCNSKGNVVPADAPDRSAAPSR
ncbi:GerMN domain-containing protein [Streptomyces albus]|uniref:GerMN domain-containing protein n=1 Tax=Streptomyces albus TaxID=1888 RepID=A0A6C1CAQ1_9ACTN|nr:MULTISPECIES: GerMN domain-containing protein [Streptomyces]EPD91477.1 hypothetical protein HMPREF1486_04435 [Streptomyces sp. HPH0547]QID39409.1 GerMN domain-containing protein [Streptomyces albus]TGG86147.1 hypothetical protein D8771_07005 [Streptomyces albus]UVN53532.1 GerMN domain-containing protein [Streptomyces albus]GHJ24132.1 lipoprotein [Streptomyces albus]